MTAVVVAMLGIVVLATGVLAAVGGYHHFAHSPWFRRRVRRWRYVATLRVDEARESGAQLLRVTRRTVAERLSRPVGGTSRVRAPLPR
ncbi:hypothetical protein CLV30_10334 [Haloactinopolyspora alba]|uniref:Uncharacterized protein n=1 Tax=Haloactinopolyspora alba TaxID=648780 RepID=A0A2P8E8U4_9ACTN|nr:hypothetical protein [Haloactinopolyspora alba]PSL05883.1 hypothetical protein CLV30_10334 [Haloactinopolyspora alba]